MSSVNLNFYAHSLRFRTEVRVVLPEYPAQRNPAVSRREAYDPSIKFPAVYLLHGFTGDYTDWTNMLPIERYASQYGFAVVMPHGYNTWYLNVPDGPQMEDMIADELPAAMEALLPISSNPADRFIAGLSMGGGGAMRVAYRYPERYRAVAAMSAVPDLTLSLNEPAEMSAYEDLLRRSIERCHGGPEGMYDEDKNIMLLAAKRMKEGCKLPPLLFQYGEQDCRFDVQYPAFKRFAEEQGLPAEFTTAPGGHDFLYWDKTIQETLAWFRRLHDGNA